MSTLTSESGGIALQCTQKKEIRALALQAAAVLLAHRLGMHGIDAVVEYTLDCARTFETYIEEGRIPKDDEDDLDIDGTGR